MKTLITIAGLVLVIALGFLIFDGNDELADVDNNGNITASSTEDITGTGGPEDDFDPINGVDPNNPEAFEGVNTDEETIVPDKG